MSDGKFKNKYRIASARLPHWDYGRQAAYFVTICTKNRQHYFGSIQQGMMYLSDIGKIAEQEWIKTPAIRPDMNLTLGEFVVMPNHFHGIIIIGENSYNAPFPFPVETRCIASLPETGTGTGKFVNQFGPQSKNLASIMRGFKSAVTKNARCMQADFAWQSRYHDHIIRNETSFHNISQYIKNNPLHWQKDTFYNR